MKKALKYFRNNLDIILLGGLFIFALINPVFKKYDYGPGFPLVMLGAFSGLIIYFLRFRLKREFALWEAVSLIVFAVFIVLSFMYSQAKNFGLSEVMAFLSIIPVYLLTAHSKFKNRKKLLKILVSGALLAGLLGFLQFFWSSHPRMFGPFFNVFYHANVWPNAFALFLLMAWPLTLLYFKKNYVVISLLISCLLLTYSRGAVIAFGGQLILLAIFYFRSFNLKTIIKIIICAGLALVMFLIAAEVRSDNREIIDVSDRIEFENEEGLTSARERIDFWMGAIEITKNNPLLGTGPFSFRYAYNPIQQTLLGASDHPHNIFLKIASENGLIALASFVVFLLSWLITLGTRFKSLEKAEKETVFVIFVCVAGAIAHNLIDYNFNFYVNLLMLVILLAISRSYVAKNLKKPRLNIFILLISLLISIISVYEVSVYALGLRTESFYVRDDLTNKADELLQEGDYAKSLSYIKTQLKLNPLDSRAKYLEGVIYCSEDYEKADEELCEDKLIEAIELNPMNNIRYYTDAFRELEPEDPEFDELLVESLEILYTYFDYVQKNVHFTAYTPNVEAASELVSHVILFTGLKDSVSLSENNELMLKKAHELRESKSY
ncbi:hypothetical protein GF354_01615 [Candidatus Peregrinibacteria bacterium]|nr:hypothetical protein [Candidatus Peregrinibacteria bacterium]